MEDIVFNFDEGRFNFRVALVPYNDKNQVLLQKVSDVDYVSLVGGRVKICETTEEAICREVKEELGIDIKKEELELVYICENFFSAKNRNFHEILFVYKYPIISIESFKILDKSNDVADWHDINELKKLNIKPKIIKDFNLEQKLKRVIIREK